MRRIRSALLIALLAAPMTAPAIEVTPVESDQALVALLGGAGEPGVAFVAQGRIGIPGAGDYELSLGADTSQPPLPTAQYGWVSGEAVKFSLAYSAGVATFALGGETLEFKVGDEQLTDLFLRARATDTSSVALTELVLDGEKIDDVVAKGGVGILQVSAPKLLADGFDLTGLATLSWIGTAPTRSSLAFQIKAGESATVPEPSAALLLLAVAGVLFGVSRTRTRAA